MKLETNRLLINELNYDDSEFLITLLNQPSFKEHIGDKQVTDLASAKTFLDNGPLATYPQEIGMYCVRELISSKPVGICGLMKRPFLALPDIGYAFLETEHGKGLAFEAATAFIEKARKDGKYQMLCAMTSMHNTASIKLLTNLSFQEKEVDNAISALENCRYFERTI